MARVPDVSPVAAGDGNPAGTRSKGVADGRQQRSNDRPLPVLIFGADLTALGVLRALSLNGVECYVADDTGDLITRSRWYRPAEKLISITSSSEELSRYLTSLELPGAVLIACNDGWAPVVAGVSEELRKRFPVCAPPRATVEKLTDKDLFGALVRRLEIPHPATMDVNSVADLDKLSDQQLADGFLKPTNSVLHRRHFITKGSFVRSREAARQRVKEAAALGIDFVFQEWIPGPYSRSILIDGVIDRHGEIHALTSRRRVRQYPPRLGTTASSVGIPLEEVAEAVDSVRRLLADISYRGFFNIEFKYDERDGHYKIIEFNPRPCYYTGTLASGGVNLPWLAYHEAQELPLPKTGVYPVGRYALYEFGDGMEIVRSLRSLKVPEGKVVRTWLTGDRALFWWRDPMPTVGSLWSAFGRRVRRVRERSARARETERAESPHTRIRQAAPPPPNP